MVTWWFPLANHTAAPTGVFELVLWQPNPFARTALLVPTTWDAGSQTGFVPPSPSDHATRLPKPERGTTTAQMDGDTVGAYLNSADLPGSPDGPENDDHSPVHLSARGSEPVPFASSTSTLNAAMDLQVPTATGSDTYVVAYDLLFKDPNGLRVSFGVKIFGQWSDSAE